MCGTFINFHTVYKMYFNEYNLAQQSLRRIVLHNGTISSQGTYSSKFNIINNYSKLVSVVIVLHHVRNEKISLFRVFFQKEIKLVTMSGLDTQTG